MIDLFFCASNNPELAPDLRKLRYLMAQLCEARWRMQPDVTFRLTTPGVLMVTPKAFQRERRIYADANSNSPIYIVADDDCLLPSTFYVQRALNLMASYPQFGQISLLPSNNNTMEWDEGFKDDQIFEHVSAGGIRIMRKGCLKDWPKQDGQGYDKSHGEALRAAGFRTGFSRHLTQTHLGEGIGYSTVWQ